MAEFLTSHDDPDISEGSIVNQVQSVYNDFGQLVTQYQAHGGSVNTSTTPKVQYAYADGSANTIRPTSMTYPNGRVLTYGYGGTDGTNDVASRIESLIDDDSTHLADYEYLGLGSIVEVDYTEPDLRYRLFDPSLSGDIYTSLDQFGRVIDCNWYDYGSSTSAARIKYGYDRASKRTWREDIVAAANGKHFDELYSYDGLQRLKDMQRGTLNGSKDAVTNLQFEQCWSLDATGNWSGFRSDDDGNGSWDLVQSRTASPVNEITGISETTGPSWATPAYDPAGNMTTLPKPADPTEEFSATYDAWNRMVKLEDGEDTVQENEYDARRFRTVRKDYESGVLNETRHIFYTTSWQSIEERLDSESNPERQTVWGLQYVDDLVLRNRDTTRIGVFDETLYGIADDNHNMIAIADESGIVQECYAYAAYGDPSFFSPTFVSRSSSLFEWNTLSASYHYDNSVGVFYVRYRYLNSRLGFWISRDPAGYNPTLNLYEDVSSSPLTIIDPLGLGLRIQLPRVAPRATPKFPRLAPGTSPVPDPPIFTPPKPIPPVTSGSRYPMPGWPGSEPVPKAPRPEHTPADKPLSKPWRCPKAGRDGKGSDCSQDELDVWNKLVSESCDPKGCSHILSTIWTCDEIEHLRRRWETCCGYRRARELKCYRGGDYVHRLEIAKCEYQLSYCYYLLRYWECPGYKWPSIQMPGFDPEMMA